MFKFGHSADIHFGALKRWAPYNNEYLERHKHNLSDLIKKVKEEKLDFFFIVGDFFDTANINISDLLYGAEFLRELAEICPVFLTPGNHDELMHNFFVTEYLKDFKIPNLYIFNEKTLFTYYANSKQIVPTTVLTKKTEDAFTILASTWTGIKNVDAFKAYLTGDIPYGVDVDIAMLHECFMGSVLDNGRKMSGVEVPDIGAKYYACGDIHKFQKLNLPQAYFSGSPMQVKTDDSDEKGFIVVEVHTPFDYRPRFVKLENQIRIIQISDLNQIVDTSNWYKLVCPINRKPLEIPSCVKCFEPLPAIEDQALFIQAEQAKEGIEQAQEQSIQIDYLFGVSDLMVESQFTKEEIEKTKQEIEEFIAGAGA